jgi:hypothetical protein
MDYPFFRLDGEEQIKHLDSLFNRVKELRDEKRF